MCVLKTVQLSCLFLLYIILPQRYANAENLLTNYLPVSMQALAYYIDYLQYEPLSTTTVEPPFSVSDEDLNSVFSSASSASHTTTTATPTTIKTTAKPTTRRPSSSSSGAGSSSVGSGSTTTSSWWKPPSWWQQTTTTTKRPTAVPTHPHRPAIYAPVLPSRDKGLINQLEGYTLFNEIADNPEGFDVLPLSLIRDIQTEANHDEFTNDVESLDNFLRLYDDNYGRATIDADAAMDRWSTTSTAGKKRVPPTKPYVEFLLVYDLLKRDAKAENLSKYEGYSAELLKDMHELSKGSAERQLYTICKRMLERRDIQRTDVVSRIQGIMKDLANPNSATSKALRYIPAMPFAL